MSNDDVDSFIETIYVITSQHLTINKLEIYCDYFGHKVSLSDACKKLGCTSFNHVIRRYREKFESFIEIYTCPNGILYYFNKHIHETGLILNDYKDKKMDGIYALISYDDTIYFENHNQDKYLTGRAEFTKLVYECESTCFTDKDGIVPITYIQDKIQERFSGKKYPEVIKEWFDGKHLETIMKEIIFEDLDCFFSSSEYKKVCRFGLKRGLTLDEILANIQSIRTGRATFIRNRDAQLYS